jgi:hypothetical protein
MPKLGRLGTVDPRTVWKHEARDFTPWLRKNIELLSEKLGLELDLVEQESEVGEYAVDLYAKEMGTGKWVIIENQLTQTDHTHLGQLMAYAAGKDAGVVIWISPDFRDEHRHAIDWLNELSGEKTHFFAIELEVLQIDDSLPAANLKLVAQPLIGIPPPPRDLTELQRAYLGFFTDLLEQVKDEYPGLTRARKAYPQNWYGFPIGRSGFSISVAFSQEDQFRVELYMDTGNKARNKAAYDALHQNREAIEDEIGEEVVWQRLDERQACRVFTGIEGRIDEGRSRLDEMLRWGVQMVGKYNSVFRPLVEQLELG